MSVPKRAAQKMGKHTEMFGKRKKLKHRERSKTKQKMQREERKKERKLRERENVDSLTHPRALQWWM